jgi:uncharacterized protein with von Willebrand factor type A (vWA) domain
VAEAGDITGVLVGFGRELRAAGLVVGTGDVLVYADALAVALSPADLLDLYWAGRATLVSRRDDIPVYDRVFRSYFLGEPCGAATALRLSAAARREAEAALVMPACEPGDPGQAQEQPLGWMASDAAALKHRSFASCTPDELAALRRIMKTMRLTPPRRRTRRLIASPGGPGRVLDVRRMVRAQMRRLGEPPPLAYRVRKTRVRPLVLLLDVSGSMTDYSRALLQFAHATGHAAARTEVFVFGTRLARITRQLRHRRPDVALDRAARSVTDWDGGTRIGLSVEELTRRWGRAGMCRGAVVVICSDGLDRGDPALLETAMERLGRLAYRIVWVSPHGVTGMPVGMTVAAPHVDLLLSGHDLASLEELAEALPSLR